MSLNNGKYELAAMHIMDCAERFLRKLPLWIPSSMLLSAFLVRINESLTGDDDGVVLLIQHYYKCTISL